MNERIKELIKQAGCTIDGMGYGEGNVEKFAELIVLECARVSATKAGTFDKDSFVAKRIKQHFGVEE